MTNIDYQPYYYKKSKRKPTTSRGNVVLVMIVMIVFCLTVLIVYKNDNNTSTPPQYYAVYSDVVGSISTASSIASTVKMRGGAGYIYKIDEGYAVFTSIYNSLDNARQVADTLSATDTNAGVYTLKPSASATRILTTTHEAYLELYTMSKQADTSTLLQEQALTKIHSIINTFEDRYDELGSLNAEEQSYISAITDNQLAYLEDLLKNPIDPSLIRYCYCAILCAQSQSL